MVALAYASGSGSLTPDPIFLMLEARFYALTAGSTFMDDEKEPG